jgi:hypothetical protein
MTAADIPTLIAEADQGRPGAASALFSALYSELHRLAQRELARGGGPGVPLGVTTLAGGGSSWPRPSASAIRAMAR